MSATPPPSYTPPPADLPQRGIRATFSNLMDTWITWFSNTSLAQVAALAANAYANALAAFDSAEIATTQAAAAVAAVNAEPFVPGFAYTAGDAAYSLIDYRNYRRKSSGSSTTDPKIDTTNWQLQSNGPAPRLHIQEQAASGNSSPSTLTATTWSTRVFNTQVLNNIYGASLASNQVTLPAGTYNCEIACPATSPNAHRIRLYDVTHSVVLGLGVSSYMNSSTGSAILRGRFTLTSTSTLRVDHFAGQTTTGGQPVSTGDPEIYGVAIFEQVEG